MKLACIWVKLHRHTQRYDFPINSYHDLRRCTTVFTKIEGHLTTTNRALINDELRFQANNHADDLPQGVIHGDLFRDNALFVDDQVSGILDFYSACNGPIAI